MKQAMSLLAAAAACLMLVLAGSAAASVARDNVRAGGYVHTHGTSGARAYFKMILSAGPGNKIAYQEPGLFFRATNVGTAIYGKNDVKVSGTGLANGKRVHFTAIAVAHPTAADVFVLDWNGVAARGGKLLSGRVNITPNF